jgi:hypothetical protein
MLACSSFASQGCKACVFEDRIRHASFVPALPLPFRPAALDGASFFSDCVTDVTDLHRFSGGEQDDPPDSSLSQRSGQVKQESKEQEQEDEQAHPHDHVGVRVKRERQDATAPTASVPAPKISKFVHLSSN